MKWFTSFLLASLGVTLAFAAPGPQLERVLEAQEYQGDRFAESLYWLPESREAFRNHIADHADWVGFEVGRWQLVPDTVKSAVFKEIGEAFDQLDGARLERTWKRIHEWQSIHSQLALFESAMDGHEAFFDLAFQDPALKPAFDWILAERPEAFDARFIGATFSAGQLPSFRAHLTEHLLEMSASERYKCYSRIYERIAAHQSAKGE